MSRRCPDPSAAWRAAGARPAGLLDLHDRRHCDDCEHWLAVPKRTVGLCEKIHASTRPDDLCDCFWRRGCRLVPT